MKSGRTFGGGSLDSNSLVGAFSAPQARNPEFLGALGRAKQAEQEELWLIDTVPARRMVTDATGTIMRANEAARRLFNLADKYPSLQLDTFITTSDYSSFKKQFQRPLAARLEKSEQNFELAPEPDRGPLFRRRRVCASPVSPRPQGQCGCG